MTTAPRTDTVRNRGATLTLGPLHTLALWKLHSHESSYPFSGSRMLRDMLRSEGLVAGHRHVRTLMHRMGIEALYRKPNTSMEHPGHKVYPYLLRRPAT